MTSRATSASRRLWLRAWLRNVANACFHVDAFPLGDHPFRLLDDDAAVQSVVELFVEDLSLERGAVLEDGDGGDVGERLGGLDVGLSHLPGLDVEQVEGTDDRAAQPHRQRVDRVEAGGERFGGESGPAAVDRGQVLVHDWLARPVAVEARAFLRLQLEQLQHAHGLAGGSHHPQVTVWCDQHESSGVDVEHVDATVSKQRQQLHHVEVGDERVGQLDERLGQHRFSRHEISSHSAPIIRRHARTVTLQRCTTAAVG